MLPALLPDPALKAVCSFLKEMSSIEIFPRKPLDSRPSRSGRSNKNAPFTSLSAQFFPTFSPIRSRMCPFFYA